MKPFLKSSYIAGGNFPSSNLKQNNSEKVLYISGNRTFFFQT